MQLLFLPQASLPGKPFTLLCVDDVRLIFLFIKQAFKMLFPGCEGHFSIFLLMLALLTIFMRLFTDYKLLLHNEICGCLIHFVQCPMQCPT